MTNATDWTARRAFAQAALLADRNIRNGAVHPLWIDEDHFRYERTGEEGPAFRVVHAPTGETRLTLNRSIIAKALADHLDVPVDPAVLIVGNPQFDLSGGSVDFMAYGDAYRFAVDTGVLTPVDKKSDISWLASPDGSAAALLRANNLWLRDLATGEERALTTDGQHDYAYADKPLSLRDLSSRLGDAVPEAMWSPDSRWLFTLQVDERHVPDLSLAEYAPMEGVRPVIHSNKTCLPEDPKVTEFRMIAVEAATGRQVEARYPRLTAVRMNNSPFSAGVAWWSADSRTAYFVDIERGEQVAHVVAFDVMTGATRIVFTETASAYVEVSVNVYTPALVAPIAETNELVWYSERSGHGHLYLYDLVTGALKNAITQGPWQIRDVLRVDPARREVFFTAAGIAAEEGPYIVKPCVASLDGGETRLLSDAPGEHIVWPPRSMALTLKQLEGLDPGKISGLSPSGRYFVETVSPIDSLPETWLRDQDGKTIALLERAEGELPVGWQWPEAVKCKAADGETDTYGLLFKPMGWDPAQSYPIIDAIYGGPQVSNVPHGSFVDGSLGAMTYIEAAHLSSLGAFVLVLDGRGTAEREQAFRTASHRSVHTASNLEDHIAAIRQIAQTYPQIDLDRVGITGFSGGGYMTAHAALRFGDFFKVAVAGGGNYDQALFWHCWGERYHGPYEPEHYGAQAAKSYAAGLSGKLMLVHGMMDQGCHPAALFQLVQALVDANKDHELVLLPRARHEWTGYGMRRRWDYFATHLCGGTPPAGEPFKIAIDDVFARAAANARKPEKPA